MADSAGGSAIKRFRQGQGGAIAERLPYVTVLLLGLAISIAAFLLVQNLHRTAALKAFEGPAGRYATAIAKALDSHLEVVKSAGSFFSAANGADRWEFFEFARDPLPRHPAIQAIAWVPRVSDAERARYEASALEDGLFGFHFYQLDSEGKPVTAAPRAAHYPIYYIEPFLDNEQSLGLDLAADPESLAALEAARDAGRLVVTLTGPGDEGAEGTPMQAADQAPTLLSALLPVYEGNVVPEGRSERQAKLLGFVRGAIRLEALVAAVRQQQSGAVDLDVVLLDRAEPAGEAIVVQPALATAGADVLAGQPSGLRLVTDLEVGDRRWSLVITPGRGWRAPSKGLDPWSVLVIGLLLTGFLLQHLITARERTRVIEKAVTARTAELRELNSVLAQEVSERKQAELDLRAAKEKVEVASRAKSEFLAMMGHELRTPLNAVIGFSEILRNETFGPLGDPRYRSYVADIAHSGSNLLSIINDILDLTKIETNEFDLHEEAVDIAGLVAEVCEAARDNAAEAGLSLEMKTDPKTPALTGSRQAIKRIVDVLLSNALKFTPQGGRITVASGTSGDGGVAVEVADNGIGIAPKDQQRIFQPFTQVDQTLSRRHEGTGLGLTLALRLVELHGGVLRLDSQLGEGTRVRVNFPAQRSLPLGPSVKVKKVKKVEQAKAVKTGESAEKVA